MDLAAGKFTWNDDTVTEILLRLPAKSLTRFKLVCKYWLSIISSQQFSQLHALRHCKPQPSFILRTQTTSHFFYFDPLCGEKLVPYHFSVPNPKILSSSNGLLLLESEHPGKGCYVYNPTTRKSRHVHLPDSSMEKVMGLNLAFDPLKSPHYKIICIRGERKSCFRNDRRCQIEVYDSESQTWMLSLESFMAYMGTNFPSGVHWKNAIHWENHPRAHMYFDIDKNVIGKLPCVPIPWPRAGGGGAACQCQLQESNGSLYHFIIVSDLGDKSIAVLELQSDYSQWLLKHHDKFGRLPGMTRTLWFVRGDSKGTVDTMVYHVPGKITAYKFMDKSFREIDLTNEAFYREQTVLFEPRDVHLFGESLAPV